MEPLLNDVKIKEGSRSEYRNGGMVGSMWCINDDKLFNQKIILLGNYECGIMPEAIILAYFTEKLYQY